ncbi:MAG: metallophosphoesterase [Lachnospiraceae bacterium]|nr:metallophosphoesterase [Lachnospiraceae bacterium]
MKQGGEDRRTEQPVIRFVVLSDIHVGSSDLSDENSKALAEGLEDIRNLEQEMGGKITALITVGDHTQNGSGEQTEGFYRILDRYAPLSDDRILVALGNHDARGPGPAENWSEDPLAELPFWNETAKPLYLARNRRYMPKEQGPDTVYYDKWLDGYHFIVLNTENGIKDACTLSDGQLSWLEEKLSEAEDERPVFLFVHQPLVDTHWRSNILNGFGLEDEKVKAILKKYPQTILMCGHIHNGHGVTEAVVREYGTTVEVPSYNESENGYREKGSGCFVEVYKDKVVYRARNFNTSAWLPEYDIVVKLPVLGAVYQKACRLDKKEGTEASWDAVEGWMKEAENIFESKYMQDHLAWDDASLPPVPLFSKETGEKADWIAENLQAAVEKLQRES